MGLLAGLDAEQFLQCIHGFEGLGDVGDGDPVFGSDCREQPVGIAVGLFRFSPFLVRRCALDDEVVHEGSEGRVDPIAGGAAAGATLDMHGDDGHPQLPGLLEQLGGPGDLGVDVDSGRSEPFGAGAEDDDECLVSLQHLGGGPGLEGELQSSPGGKHSGLLGSGALADGGYEGG